MAARNVNLTDHLADFVDANVATGRFQNASEVVREGLRLLEQRQREDELKLERLRQAVEVGREDAKRGRTVRIEPDQIGVFLAKLGRTGQLAE
jgi:antitoxin ParD1/3/4